MDIQNAAVRGLIPAAGLSSRMRDFKPLLPFRGGTVIEAAAASLLDGGADTVTVVTGYRAEDVEAALRGAFPGRVGFVRNPDYAASDMLRSVQLGCAALPACGAFFLLPGDMPAVEPATCRALLDARPEAGPYILFPLRDGRRGHPPLISAGWIGAILDFREEGGLRRLWAGWERITRDVPVTDGGVTADLDTPLDYQRLKQVYDNRERS